jgi:Uma2 family endonuclease
LTPFPTTAAISTPPDWVAEILSPSTARIDRTDKLAIYAAYGVSHCWLIDPDAKTLEVFQLTGGKWLLVSTHKDADAVAAVPFEVHTFQLDVLWV